MFAPASVTPDNQAKARRILALSESEQLAFFLTTGPGEYARKASARGQKLRFRNWQRYLRAAAKGKAEDA